MITVSGKLKDSTGNIIVNGYITIYSITNTTENLKGSHSTVRTNYNGEYNFTLNNGAYAFYSQVSLITDIKFLGYGQVTSSSVNCSLNDLLSDIDFNDYLDVIDLSTNTIKIGKVNKVLELIGSQVLVNGGIPYTSNNKPSWSDIQGTTPTWTISWDNISDKPLTFTPSSHNHTLSDITDINSITSLLDLSSYQPLLQFTDNIDTSTDIPYSRAVYRYLQGYTDSDGEHHKGEIEKIYDILNNKELVIAQKNDSRTISSNAVINTIESYMTELNTNENRFGKVEVDRDTKAYYTFSTEREIVLVELTIRCYWSPTAVYNIKVDGNTIYKLSGNYTTTSGCTGSTTSYYYKVTDIDNDWKDYITFTQENPKQTANEVIGVHTARIKLVLPKGKSFTITGYKDITIEWQNYNTFNYNNQRIDQSNYTDSEILDLWDGKEL